MENRQALKSPPRSKRNSVTKPRENSVSAASDPSAHTNPSLDSPVPSTSDQSFPSENNNPVNWDATTSHVENAKRALGQLEGLVDDAVFLDDDTFNGMKTLAYYNQKLQSGQRRVRQLSEQLLAAQAQLARKDEQLKEEREIRKGVETKVEDLNAQIESNAVVFEMHLAELLKRNEEIERLKAVIEGLSSSNV